MILDFKEIPQANLGSGVQDTFELFARDFLQTLGYKIIYQPDRGADGKKDLIVQESREGLSGITNIKWLVSCKHYAHSGKSVTDKDESNIVDRVLSHECNGFLGFYSTLPAVSLVNNLRGLESKIVFQIFDREQIERTLLDTLEGLKLANRYFPKSYSSYRIENPNPAKIFFEEPSIRCDRCGRNLLEGKGGIFVLLRRFNNIDINEEYKKQPYVYAYFSCKGACDNILKRKYLKEEELIDEWIDIMDFLYPTGYILKVMTWINALQRGELIETDAFEKLKKLFLNAFPYISRDQTTEENNIVRHYIEQGSIEFL